LTTARQSVAPEQPDSGLPRGAPLVADFSSDEQIKGHPDYRSAKAGDVDAAARLVRDLVKPESLEKSREMFGPDAVFVPVHAQETSGRNQIPNMLALAHAQAAGAKVDTSITQTNKAFHTGAGPMERLTNRAEFDGHVEPGRRYVLVDDVTTMGSTLADLASYIQRHGGRVAGSVLMVNAARGGKMDASPRVINELEARHGQTIRNILGVSASRLTGPEAQYLIGFKSTDELRNRAAKAEQERVARIRSKEVLSGRTPDLTPDAGPRGSVAADAQAPAGTEPVRNTDELRLSVADAQQAINGALGERSALVQVVTREQLQNLRGRPLASGVDGLFDPKTGKT
jgi:hypothetical protein